MNTVRTFPKLGAIALGALLAAGAAGCSSGTTSASVTRRAPAPTTSTTSTTSTTEARPAPPTAAIDELIAVGGDGARMHLSCSGSGSPTVVFVSGFGGGSEGWEAVAQAAERVGRVCTYARFGAGTSDAPTADQTFETQADDLHELLEVAGEQPPFVLAGHSFGGAGAVTFADRFPGEVTGLVLIDASPVGWPTAACAVPDDGSDAAVGFRDTCTSFQAERNPERLDVARAFEQVGGVDSLGDVPLAVLTRADISYPGMAPEALADLAATWHEGQEHWASLSSAAELVPVEDTGHSIQVDQPAIVTEKLLEVIEAAGR